MERDPRAMENAVPERAVFSTRGACCLAAAVSAVLLVGVAPAGLDARWVFLGTIVLFGLTHGACDVWLPGWVRGRVSTVRFLAAFCLAYTAVAGLVLWFWDWQPGLALAGFLLLTAWHWGSADAVLTGARAWRFGSLAWGRGLLVMAAPAAFHPQATLAVFGALAPVAFALFPPDRLRTLGILVSTLAVGAEGLVWSKRPRPRELASHSLETVFLIGLFAVCPPLIGTAVYFVWFHAWRHILRLCRWQSPASGNRWAGILGFHRAALPCTLGALGLLWLVARAWPGDLLRAYLILLSAVTLPHALLVFWLDRVESRLDSRPWNSRSQRNLPW